MAWKRADFRSAEMEQIGIDMTRNGVERNGDAVRWS
nr:MAG TPA: hypothetical protein [Caudoviricetes sp.]